jgi:hypothetical protein
MDGYYEYLNYYARCEFAKFWKTEHFPPPPPNDGKLVEA